ncbi:MAG: hypothetical protein IRZ05_02615 [Micromonosporaceae bacterium]|nr:hypothetical protein [Micromonosporaceae bacterium]
MSFDQLMEHAYEIQQLAVEKYMKRWRANQPGLYAPWEQVAGEAQARARIELEVADIPGLFAPFAVIPDPALYHRMIEAMDQAIGRLSPGTWQETGEQPSLTDGYDANSDLAVMSSTASWLAKWSGYAAREFKTKFIDPFPYILHNQARLARVVRDALDAQQAVCRKGRQDIDDMAHKVLNALHGMGTPAGGGDLSFVFTAVGAVLSFSASAASGAAAVGLTAVASAASIAAQKSGGRPGASSLENPLEVQYRALDIESIMDALRAGVGNLKKIILEQEDAIASAMKASLEHVRANRKDFVAPRPKLANATAATVGSRDFLGFAH